MKLTEQHVSEMELDYLINYYDSSISWVPSQVFSALLELKQRRAEDRQREANGE